MTYVPQIVTRATAVAAARMAYTEGRLGAQNNQTTCRYRYDDGSGCAIGVGLTDATIAEIKRSDTNASVVDGLIRQGIITVEGDAHTSADLRLLQAVHDRWIGSADPDRARAFVRVLQQLEAKVAAAPRGSRHD